MTAFEFGRQMRKQAFELPPLPAEKPPAPPPPAGGPPPLVNSLLTQKPTWMKPPAAPPPPPPPPKPADNFWTGQTSKSNPTFLDDYKRTLSRYISPWNQDTSGAQGKDRGAIDEALKWSTRGSLATGAAAGTAAAGVAAAGALGSSTAAGGAATTAAAGSQTPTGQNMLQRGVQTIGQFGNQAANTYQNNIEPALKRLNYKPEDVLHDVYAAGTGHLDQVKGPALTATPSLPKGAPSFPKPLETWKNIYSAGVGMLPNFSTPPIASTAKML